MFVVPGSNVRVACRGISQSDVAVLVVDPSPVEFDASFSKGGRAAEHVLLAYTFGLKELIVVVNKMDSSHVRYASARFEELKNDILSAVKKAGFSQNVSVIPVSGLMGDNVSERGDNLTWYKGPTLAQLLADLAVPARVVVKPLRLIVRDVFRPSVAAGRIVQGSIRVGQVVTMAPRMITTSVESIQMRGKPVESASAGDVVGVMLKDVDWCELDRGAVIGDSSGSRQEIRNWCSFPFRLTWLFSDPPRVCAQFVAKIIPYNISIRSNFAPLIVCHGAVPCSFVKLLNKSDKKTKEVTENPEMLTVHEHGQVLLVPLRPIVLDAFETCPSLSRLAVRDSSKTVALGVISICTPDSSTKRRVIREKTVRKTKDKK
jgi:elongation factor 1-alpha